MLARGLLIVLVLLAAGMAGCASPQSSQPQSKILSSPQQVVHPASLLRVLVITDEFLPVAGAHVNIVGLGLNATTDDVGNAFFQIGTPGRYALHVHHPRYYPNMTKVSIDGSPKLILMVTLRDAPRDAHMADFYEYEGLCGPTVYVPGLTPPDCRETPPFDRPYPHWFLGEGLTQGYFELSWTDQATGPKAMQLSMSLPDAGAFADGQTTLTAHGSSPVRLYIHPNQVTPEMRTNGHEIQLRVGVDPNGLPVATNLYQEFTIDAELDYYLPAPVVDMGE